MKETIVFALWLRTRTKLRDRFAGAVWPGPEKGFAKVIGMPLQEGSNHQVVLLREVGAGYEKQ